MRINFDFADLEAFLAVKETGSFQAAASQLNLSQSSITRRVQKLEDALGTLLFERTTRAVRPTLAAKRFQSRAEAIVQDAQEATRAMRDETEAFRYQRLQTLTLATIPTIMTSVVIPAIHRFRGSGQQGRIRLMDLAANEVAEAVSEGQADLGICSLPMLEPKTEFQPLFNEPIGLVASMDHPLAQQNSVEWHSLESEALIVPARGTGNRLLIDEALAKTKKTLHWTYEVGRSTSALDLVMSGIGLALLPRSAVYGAPHRKVRWRNISEVDVARPIGLLSRQARVDTDIARRFKTAILDVLEAEK